MKVGGVSMMQWHCVSLTKEKGRKWVGWWASGKCWSGQKNVVVEWSVDLVMDKATAARSLYLKNEM